MNVDSLWLYSFMMVFVRSSAMFLSSPLFGQSVPPRVRVLFCALFAFCVVGQIQGFYTSLPGDLLAMGTAVLQEAAMGFLIGLTIQFLLMAAQIAGAFMDQQMGFQNSQMFNPQLGTTSTILGQFKFLLFFVMFLIMDGHHQMIIAFFESYRVGSVFTLASLESAQTELVKFLGGLFLLALQIAAPVAAVGFVVDAASGLINKSIPQMQVFMVSMGAKTALGLIVLALGLPLMTMSVRGALNYTETQLEKIVAMTAKEANGR
jgi:flagellar biosynthesis protein FliR